LKNKCKCPFLPVLREKRALYSKLDIPGNFFFYDSVSSSGLASSGGTWPLSL
jgi:hypothetical protein